MLPFFFFFLTFLAAQFCKNAAAVMLSGQVADGFATIFIGELVFKPYFLCSF